MAGLILEDISKKFGSVVAARDVNLELPHGRFVCFLGPSGCGKTTLLRLIAGLETPTTGRILLDGKSITRTPAHKRNFGMVFQSLALFPHLSVGENITYSLRVRHIEKASRRKKAEKLLELVQLSGFADRHISQLSGGQQQRVAIARAIVGRPKLLLADEPTGNLDSRMGEEVMQILEHLNQEGNSTVVMVTHDPRLAERTQRTVISPFPLAANSGQYFATGASRSSRPASTRRLAQMAVTPLVAEKTSCSVSSCQGRSPAASAVPPQRSTTGRPST